jgi:hypothetical protein
MEHRGVPVPFHNPFLAELYKYNFGGDQQDIKRKNT